jgi:dienelactone hydrolase
LDEVEEIELTVGSDAWSLPATLTVPKSRANTTGKCPGVVLVHGSGPHDRDETVGPNKPFKDIALGLASRGVCTLRYVKRTKQHGKKVMEQLGEALTVKEETVDDALAAADALRKQAVIDPDRVFVLGHSLGGYAIPRIAKRASFLRGFVVMAGSTRPLEDLVVEQVKHIAGVDGTLTAQEKKSIAAIEKQAAAAKALTEDSVVSADALPLGIAAPYWLDLRAHDPTALIAKDQRPILVLQGDRDYQVTAADFAGWEKALAGRKNATLRRYPKLNHLFIAGEGPSTPAEYQQPGHVDEEVIEDVATFMKKS